MASNIARQGGWLPLALAGISPTHAYRLPPPLVCPGRAYPLPPGGHCFPGSDDTILLNPFAPGQPAAFSCPAHDPKASKVVLGQEVMKFFLANPKHPPASPVPPIRGIETDSTS